jgi:flagellar basal body-associated protein FliL
MLTSATNAAAAAGLVAFLVVLPTGALGVALLEELLAEDAREAVPGVGSLVVLALVAVLVVVVLAVVVVLVVVLLATAVARSAARSSAIMPSKASSAPRRLLVFFGILERVVVLCARAAQHNDCVSVTEV